MYHPVIKKTHEKTTSSERVSDTGTVAGVISHRPEHIFQAKVKSMASNHVVQLARLRKGKFPSSSDPKVDYKVTHYPAFPIAHAAEGSTTAAAAAPIRDQMHIIPLDEKCEEYARTIANECRKHNLHRIEGEGSERVLKGYIIGVAAQENGTFLITTSGGAPEGLSAIVGKVMSRIQYQFINDGMVAPVAATILKKKVGTEEAEEGRRLAVVEKKAGKEDVSDRYRVVEEPFVEGAPGGKCAAPVLAYNAKSPITGMAEVKFVPLPTDEITHVSPGLSGNLEDGRIIDYEHGDTVASCLTCQELMPGIIDEKMPEWEEKKKKDEAEKKRIKAEETRREKEKEERELAQKGMIERSFALTDLLPVTDTFKEEREAVAKARVFLAKLGDGVLDQEKRKDLLRTIENLGEAINTEFDGHHKNEVKKQNLKPKIDELHKLLNKYEPSLWNKFFEEAKIPISNEFRASPLFKKTKFLEKSIYAVRSAEGIDFYDSGDEVICEINLKHIRRKWLSSDDDPDKDE